MEIAKRTHHARSSLDTSEKKSLKIMMELIVARFEDSDDKTMKQLLVLVLLPYSKLTGKCTVASYMSIEEEL